MEMGKIKNTHIIRSDILEEKLNGSLIIIGGAEDKQGDQGILKEVCNKFNKEKDVITIATVATEFPQEVGAQYKDIFEKLGVQNINFLSVECRANAYEKANIEIIERSSIVFFTGGDQLRITSLLGGTPLNKVIKTQYEKGCVFVGTSAGASVMSDTMIVSGVDEESPKKCTVKMAPGLGFIKSVIIDQHFAQRGRIGRLLGAVAQNPESLGIGIDEDTAIIVDRTGKFIVIGSGAVYIIDGGEISYTNVSEQYPEQVLSIFDVKVHVLKNNDNFDIIQRKPIRVGKESV